MDPVLYSRHQLPTQLFEFMSDPLNGAHGRLRCSPQSVENPPAHKRRNGRVECGGVTGQLFELLRFESHGQHLGALAPRTNRRVGQRFVPSVFRLLAVARKSWPLVSVIRSSLQILAQRSASGFQADAPCSTPRASRSATMVITIRALGE